MFKLTHKTSNEGPWGYKDTGDSDYPTINNFSRLTVLSCFLKAFTDGAVITVSLRLFHASTILFV